MKLIGEFCCKNVNVCLNVIPLFRALQKVTFCKAICMVLHNKTYGFAMQYHTFRNSRKTLNVFEKDLLTPKSKISILYFSHSQPA